MRSRKTRPGRAHRAFIFTILLTALSLSCESGHQQEVFDKYSRLFWQKCTAGHKGEDCKSGHGRIFSHQEASQYCAGLSWSGKKWRLPTISEWLDVRRCPIGWHKSSIMSRDTCRASIPKDEQASCRRISMRCARPRDVASINTALFPYTPQSGFWSGSVSTSSSARAWGISFDQGYIQTTARSNRLYVRCVAAE